jgi:hypothetical protein
MSIHYYYYFTVIWLRHVSPAIPPTSPALLTTLVRAKMGSKEDRPFRTLTIISQQYLGRIETSRISVIPMTFS